MASGIIRSYVLSFAAALLAVPVIAGGALGQDEKLRFVMVTHGAASGGFWATVKEGADAAAEKAGVELVYRAPDAFDLDRMAALVEAAVEEAPDGLIVSIPNADALAGPIRAADQAGIPVISINSGFDVGRSLGALLHVGQGEYEAGREAGEAMRELGGTNALCLNHELGNVALDLRCKGFIDGFAGSVEVMPVSTDPDEVREEIAARFSDDAKIDVVLALSANIAGEPVIAAAKALEGRTVHVGTFDVTQEVLAAVADGDASFAIDQQPYLQGYLPVELLALLARHGEIPVSNVSTGPRLVTAADARQRLGRPAEEAPMEDAGEPLAQDAEPASGGGG
jgi:simple sugar transport system substrate-binding protein